MTEVIRRLESKLGFQDVFQKARRSKMKRFKDEFLLSDDGESLAFFAPWIVEAESVVILKEEVK